MVLPQVQVTSSFPFNPCDEIEEIGVDVCLISLTGKGEIEIVDFSLNALLPHRHHFWQSHRGRSVLDSGERLERLSRKNPNPLAPLFGRTSNDGSM